MNFESEFRQIGDADVTDIKKLIQDLKPEAWSKTPLIPGDEAFKDIDTLYLAWDSDLRHVNPTRHPMLATFSSPLRSIFQQVADFYEGAIQWRTFFERFGQGFFIRANFVRLGAGKAITAHRDKAFSLVHSHQIHVPVRTSDDVVFTIGDVAMNMLEGEIVEINNRLAYSLENKGQDDCIHLILDWVVPGEPCCCAVHTHPGVPCSPQACEKTDQQESQCDCLNR
ncbi:aspartyl/asparaginyl beta-hydroxylase domain-containing protein [Pleionea sediminis]|uniref:aspartyl/asparaginyl beta-hydroxylase domain-containing protein n=1 Tax=Pleionea sediminis TaxID=2569479 RepID=UPI0011853F13|nr:aspartyl/asparaginyl beta-hydroxylase domain-containing protein [Pleionea sediminis]